METPNYNPTTTDCVQMMTILVDHSWVSIPMASSTYWGSYSSEDLNSSNGLAFAVLNGIQRLDFWLAIDFADYFQVVI